MDKQCQCSVCLRLKSSSSSAGSDVSADATACERNFSSLEVPQAKRVTGKELHHDHWLDDEYLISEPDLVVSELLRPIALVSGDRASDEQVTSVLQDAEAWLSVHVDHQKLIKYVRAAIEGLRRCRALRQTSEHDKEESQDRQRQLKVQTHLLETECQRLLRHNLELKHNLEIAREVEGSLTRQVDDFLKQLAEADKELTSLKAEVKAFQAMEEARKQTGTPGSPYATKPAPGVGTSLASTLSSSIVKHINDRHNVPRALDMRGFAAGSDTHVKNGSGRYGREVPMPSTEVYQGKPDNPITPLDTIDSEPGEYTITDNGTATSTSLNRQQSFSELLVFGRKVKRLLDQLSIERFDSISDRIIRWANMFEMEDDARTLILIIRLVFENAINDISSSEIYARFCHKVMEGISPKVHDEGMKDAEGKPYSGERLFRKFLLDRCQEDFERRWAGEIATATATTGNATQTAEAKPEKDNNNQETKRQFLGVTVFITELFKVGMLTERIMHECIKKLLSNVDCPEEEEIEGLCKLLSTVGAILDTRKAKGHIDIYFTRMREISKNHDISPRTQFLLQNVIELRNRRWVSRTQGAAPSTLAQVHEAAAREKVIAEKEYQQRQAMSRDGSRRGQDRSQYNEAPDGWAVADGSGPIRPPPKAHDLTHFGKIAKPAAISQFGPSSVFAGMKENKRGPMQRTNPSSNMFSMLQNAEAASADPTTSKLSRPPSRKASVDLGQAATPETPVQRSKLKHLPRTIGPYRHRKSQ